MKDFDVSPLDLGSSNNSRNSNSRNSNNSSNDKAEIIENVNNEFLKNYSKISFKDNVVVEKTKKDIIDLGVPDNGVTDIMRQTKCNVNLHNTKIYLNEISTKRVVSGPLCKKAFRFDGVKGNTFLKLYIYKQDKNVELKTLKFFKEVYFHKIYYKEIMETNKKNSFKIPELYDYGYFDFSYEPNEEKEKINIPIKNLNANFSRDIFLSTKKRSNNEVSTQVNVRCFYIKMEFVDSIPITELETQEQIDALNNMINKNMEPTEKNKNRELSEKNTALFELVNENVINNKIYHNDLNSANVRYSIKDKKIVIIDFGETEYCDLMTGMKYYAHIKAKKAHKKNSQRQYNPKSNPNSNTKSIKNLNKKQSHKIPKLRKGKLQTRSNNSNSKIRTKTKKTNQHSI